MLHSAGGVRRVTLVSSGVVALGMGSHLLQGTRARAMEMDPCLWEGSNRQGSLLGLSAAEGGNKYGYRRLHVCDTVGIVRMSFVSLRISCGPPGPTKLYIVYAPGLRCRSQPASDIKHTIPHRLHFDMRSTEYPFRMFRGQSTL